jgi:hypothetical protein
MVVYDIFIPHNMFGSHIFPSDYLVNKYFRLPLHSL